MTQKTFIAVLGIAVLSLSCGTAGLAPCQVLPSVQGGFTVKFTRTGNAAPGCDVTNPAEFSDVWAFNNDYTVPPQGTHGGDKIDYRSATMPQPEVMPGPPNGLYGYGKWDAEFTDDSASCTMPSLDAIEGDTASIDGATTNTVRFAPTALTFLSGSAYQGAEFKGTVGVTVGTCTASYTIQALSPLVGCKTNADCDPTTFTGQAPWSATPPKFFQPFDQACFLASTHPWVAGAVAFWNSGVSAANAVTGVCFAKSDYPSIGGWKGSDQPLP